MDEPEIWKLIKKNDSPTDLTSIFNNRALFYLNYDITKFLKTGRIVEFESHDKSDDGPSPAEPWDFQLKNSYDEFLILGEKQDRVLAIAKGYPGKGILDLYTLNRKKKKVKSYTQLSFDLLEVREEKMEKVCKCPESRFLGVIFSGKFEGQFYKNTNSGDISRVSIVELIGKNLEIRVLVDAKPCWMANCYEIGFTRYHEDLLVLALVGSFRRLNLLVYDAGDGGEEGENGTEKSLDLRFYKELESEVYDPIRVVRGPKDRLYSVGFSGVHSLNISK